MALPIKTNSRIVFLTLGFLFGLGPPTPRAWSQRMPAPAIGPSVAIPNLPVANAADYVGAETCAGCHPAQAESFERTVHAAPSRGTKALNTSAQPSSAPPAAQSTPFRVTGCETCHGAGKAHADAEMAASGDHAKELAAKKLIFSFQSNPKENSARCLTCHVTSREQVTFDFSQHSLTGVSCNQCHASHLVKEVKSADPADRHFAQAVFYQVPQLKETTQWLHGSLLKQAEPNLCFSCHGNVQAEFALPIHHRVPEGLMTCSDCHSPHGSLVNRASLNAPFWETCVKCHVEKRGPWVYEHAAVRVEGCAICHNPHGSTNHFMLVRREGRQLCLQCHTGFHSQAQIPHSRLGFQTAGECTRCHVTIHGSNLDVYYLR